MRGESWDGATGVLTETPVNQGQSSLCAWLLCESFGKPSRFGRASLWGRGWERVVAVAEEGPSHGNSEI